MLETLALMPVRTMIEIVGAMLLAAVLLYATVQWSRRRGNRRDAGREAVAREPGRHGAKEEHGVGPAEITAEPHAADSAPIASMPNPAIAGKLRSARQGDRPTEDDIVRQQMGLRGVPGEPSRANALTESETQIPKALDPGHTA
jgi:hypothetical protein